MTRRYKCNQCGKIQRVIFIKEDVPESLICPECSGKMDLLPVQLNNHFHPTRRGNERKYNHEDG